AIRANEGLSLAAIWAFTSFSVNQPADDKDLQAGWTSKGDVVALPILSKPEMISIKLSAKRHIRPQGSIRNFPCFIICSSSTQMSNFRPTTSMCVEEYHCAPVCAP